MIKKYQRTANLFDKNNTTIYSAYFDASGSWILSADSKSVKMPCQPNTQYTLSVPNSLAVFRVYESNNASIEPSSTSPPRATEITRGTNISQYTFTTSSTAQIILFQGSNGAVTEWFNGLMLNEGSEALPYVPYLDFIQIPYRKYGTETDTITTLPADIIADGQSATVGLQGNMSQTGTPTPQNPIEPSECGDLSGNLFDKYGNYYVRTNAYNYTITGLKPNTQYTCSTNFAKTVNTASIYFGGGSSVSNGVWADLPNTETSTAEGTILLLLRFRSDAGAPAVYDDVIAGTIWVMVNEGSTALPYQPYGIKIPISSGNTTTPVYLGEVQSTRRIKKYEFTGQENWTRTNADYFYSPNSISDYDNSVTLYRKISSIFSHYIATLNDTNGSRLSNGYACLYCTNSNPDNYHEVYIRDNSYSTADEFKTYLAQQYANGTPVTVWYVLATPETTTLNEPLRKIGNYADSITGLTIPTTGTAEQFDVLTTLKPSEVSLTYTGWHPKSDHKF